MPSSLKSRTVLEVDEHGKHIVWRSGEFFIAVDAPDNAEFITLWSTEVRGRIGCLRLTPGREFETKGYAVVANVEILPKFRKQKLGRQLYRVAAQYVSEHFAGIASENSSRANKRQVPHIWRALGASILPCGTFRLTTTPMEQTVIVHPGYLFESGTVLKLPRKEAADLMEHSRQIIATIAAKAPGAYLIGPAFPQFPKTMDPLTRKALRHIDKVARDFAGERPGVGLEDLGAGMVAQAPLAITSWRVVGFWADSCCAAVARGLRSGNAPVTIDPTLTLSIPDSPIIPAPMMEIPSIPKTLPGLLPQAGLEKGGR